MKKLSFSKCIDIEDFSCEELSSYFKRISSIEANKFGVSHEVIEPDSKNWETAMALYGIKRFLPDLRNKAVAGIGAGTELLTELLAECGAVVFPVDRYLEQTPWSDVAPAGYMVSSAPYNLTSEYHRNIIPVHTDARCMELPSNFFDAIYSSGSIEHFGGIGAIEAAASEIGRVLKPGGVASISTEFRLDGPADRGWFDDNCILFTFDMLREHIVKPSGLELLDLTENEPSPATFETRKDLIGFLNLAKNLKTYQDKANAYPNLVLSHDGFLFCSVHLLLKKSAREVDENQEKNCFLAEVRGNYAEVIRSMSPSVSSDSVGNESTPDSYPAENGESIGILRRFLRNARLLIESNYKLNLLVKKMLRSFPRLYVYLKQKTD